MQDKEILLETGTNELEILEFFINEKDPVTGEIVPSHFGVNVAKVMQVIESPQLEPRESATHPSFLGTIPLRNHILPVIDLGVWLNMDHERHQYDIVIVTEFSQSVTGFLVSGVTEIHRVGWQEVIPPGDFMSVIGTSSIIGLVNKNDHFIQLLDLETILSDLDPHSEEDMAESRIKADREYTALIADDSATIRLMLKHTMESANFRTIIVNNGQEALKTLQKMKAEAQAAETEIGEMLDVVISDIEMPRMDGFSLTKNIKEDKVLQELPVILYSSIITKELRHKGESVRADDQVAKPEMNKMAERAIHLIENR